MSINGNVNKSICRMEWADVAKGIGIFLMVMGHSGLPNCMHDWIYSFHMPFFFILSGYFFRSGKYNVKEYSIKKFNSIIVPYVFFVISIELIRLGGNCLGLNIPSPRSIEDVVVYGIDLGATWFLLSLFFTEIIYHLLDQMFKDKRWLFLLSVMSFCVSYFCYKAELHFPYKIEILGTTLFYFCLGHMLSLSNYREFISLNRFKETKWQLFLFVLLFFDFVFANLLDPVINLRLNRLGVHVLSVVLVVFGSFVIIQFSHLIDECNIKLISKLKSFLRHIGEYSMVLIGFSQITLQIFKALVSYLDIPVWTAILIKYLLLWIVMLLLISLFKNYFPALIGKRQQHR